jgi:hypothetical protein
VQAGGNSDYTEWLSNTGITAASTNGNSYALGGLLYQRVFGSTAPVLNDYYYNSPTLEWKDKNPVTDAAQPFEGNTVVGEVGDALNIQIVPEPSTVALMLVGLGLVGYRRFRRA